MTAAEVMHAIRPFVDRGEVPGAVVGMWRDGAVSLDAAGATTLRGDTLLSADALVRVSSNTKPLVAALALALADDGVFDVADPIERFVPELRDRRVLRRLDGPLDATLPAERALSIEDLLTMRFGFGFVFDQHCPAVAAAADAGLGIGPPDPSMPLDPEEWIGRFAELPLLDQPGKVWRYDLAYAVLGVVLARAAGRPLAELLRERLLGPLGMADTSFVAPPGRLPPCYALDASGWVLFDDADGSRWTRAPSFPDARGGLVSTATDLLRFASALLDGGRGVLTAGAISAMTRDHLTPGQRRAPDARAFLDGGGWGYGVQVVTPEQDQSVRRPRYGWGGGLGTLWYSWPHQRTAAVLLTQVLPPSRELITAFISAVETALDHT